MSYTITDTKTGDVVKAETRTVASRALQDAGLNVYVAVHLLDVADGHLGLSVNVPVTVTREAPASRRIVDFYLDGTPVYEGD